MSCCPSSLAPAPAPPLEDENLLQEILLRLPPQPSSLPRASLVCKRWRSMLSDLQFLKRFRKHHHKSPLLGFFVANSGVNTVFTPELDLPDRIPPARFSVPQSHPSDRYCEMWRFTGCRHGLAVLINDYYREVVVWDPITGQHHQIPSPPVLHNNGRVCQAAVVCADAEDGHVHGDCFLSPFRLVLFSGGCNKAFACLYESSSGLWGNIASTPTNDVILVTRPTVLIGNAVCCLFNGGDILVFDIERQTLGVIEKPAHIFIRYWGFHLLRTNNGSGLVFALLSKSSIHLWERKMNSDGAVGWVLQQKIIELEGIFPCNDKRVYFAGCDEDGTVIVLSTWAGKFMLQLDSMQIRKISEDKTCYMVYHPYANFYTAGREIGWKWLDLKLGRNEIY